MMAEQIARILGGARRSGRWWSCRCPAHDDQSPSLSIRDDGDRRLVVKCWAGCAARDILTELRHLGLLDGPVEYRPPAAPVVRADDSARNVEIARRIWGEARNAHGTPVECYLAGRNLTLPVPPSLRWAPALRRPDGTSGPAMVARVDGLDGELIGIHRTFLACDASGLWRRRDRASLGPIAGGAVRLAPVAERLLVGEGIETTLAGMVATGWPGWAALSTSGLAWLVLPPVVRHVVILADHDRSGAGERSAYTAADRWLAEGRRVRVALPPEPGTDIADVLAGRNDTGACGVAA
jgi:hypothetical protein